MPDTEQTLKHDFSLPVKRVEGSTAKENLTENAYERILPARYLLKDEEGNTTEQPEDLFERVARNVAQPAKNYEEEDFEEEAKLYEELMVGLEFMPNSPTLMNAGAELQQLSACFVVHPEDDMDSIFNAVHDAAKIFQTGGGVGYPFHLMRPKGDPVSSTGGIASGSMTFQQVFDTMCGTIKQGGKRRGAQMGIMRVDHPDILRFITAKRKEGNLSNFNISVGLTEEFMEAVKNDEEFTFINPRSGEPHEVTQHTAQFYNKDEEWYPQAAGSDQGKDDNFWRDFAATFPDEIDEYDINLEPGEEMTLPARFIFDCMVDGAWRNGEPGFYNYTESNKKHSFDVEKHPEKKIEATNPCAEQPLMNYEACNLGHVNLSLMVEKREQDDRGKQFDNYVENEWGHSLEDYRELDEDTRDEVMQEFLDEALRKDRMEEVARIGTRFLDNVVDMSDFPLQEIEETVDNHRKVGLGLMGFHQMLIQVGIEYGSEESIAAAKEIQRLLTKWSVEESNRISEYRGNFGEWEKSKWANPTEHPEWFRKMTGGKDPEDFEDGYDLRNHNTVTIAPTGTTSMLGNTSGGCEPIYQVAYYKNVAKDIQGEDMLVEFDDYFLRALEANDVDVEKVKREVQERMENNEWEGVQQLSDDVIPQKAKRLFKTTNRVAPDEHVDIQAAFQEHNHSGISKTCNFPNSATREEVKDAYLRAYEKGIKGMTVYRDGTRDTQVMQRNKENTITDMDTVDAIAEMAEDFEEPTQFLQSEEVKEALDLEGASVQIQTDEDDSEELSQEVTQEGVEADDEGNGEHTSMSKGSKGQTRERPKTIEGTTQEITTPYGDLFITVNEDNEGVFEVFAQIGKAGGYTQSFTEAVGRLASLSLRSGVEADQVINQLEGIRSPKLSWDEGDQIHSVPDAVATGLKRHVNGDNAGGQTTLTDQGSSDKTKDNIEKVVETGESPECHDCGGMLELSEGCKTCPSCGWSKC